MMETLSLTLRKARLAVVADALVQLPYYVAASLIDPINAQRAMSEISR